MIYFWFIFYLICFIFDLWFNYDLILIYFWFNFDLFLIYDLILIYSWLMISFWFILIYHQGVRDLIEWFTPRVKLYFVIIPTLSIFMIVYLNFFNVSFKRIVIFIKIILSRIKKEQSILPSSTNLSPSSSFVSNIEWR